MSILVEYSLLIIKEINLGAMEGASYYQYVL